MATDGVMIVTERIALKPNREQEAFFWKCANTARFVYNYSLSLKKEVYENKGISLSHFDISKIFTQLKQIEEYSWLKETPNETIKTAIRDMDTAFKNFFSGRGYPRFKRKSRETPSFYTRYDSIKSIDERHIKICGLKKPIKTYEKVVIPSKIMNPRIKYDGKYWYLTFGVELKAENIRIKTVNRIANTYFNEIKNKEETEPLGIDLGIKNTAICSNGKVYENINKTYNVKRLERKKRRLQQQISRKFEMNKKGNKYVKTKNIIKKQKQLKLVQRKLNNIRNTFINQMTTEIVKTKPSKIVIEDLKVSNMMKNKHLAKAIQEQSWYEIRRQLEYKSRIHGIKIQIAPKFYASSKICSNCGYVDKDLKLSDRVYSCPQCKLRIDRDYNAAINLSRL